MEGGRSHSAISVPSLSSARALRVGIVLIFLLQGVCGTPAAPLQPFSQLLDRAWLRYFQVIAISSLAALAVAVQAVHLLEHGGGGGGGGDDDDDDDDDDSDGGRPSLSSVRFAHQTFFACVWLFVSSAVLLWPKLLARAEPSGRTALDLALARVILVLLFLQDYHLRGHQLHLTEPGPAGSFTVVTGLLPEGHRDWMPGLAVWNREWMSVAWFEPLAIKVFAVLALLGVCARPALLGLAVLEMRCQLLKRSHMSDRHHNGHIFPPVLLLFALAPSGDALSLCRLSLSDQYQWRLHGWLPRLCRRGVTTDTADPAPRPSSHYTLPFISLLLVLASAYATAGLYKLTNCYRAYEDDDADVGWFAFTSVFWRSDHLKWLMHHELMNKCSGESCLHPGAAVWRPLCTETVGLVAAWLWQFCAWAPPSIHAHCLLGSRYLMPAARFDLLPQALLQLAAFSAVAWEVGMWLAVLAPGDRPRALIACVAFLFHQGNIWMNRIYFDDFQDLYVVWAAPWLVLAYSRLRSRGRSEAVAAKTRVAEADAADYALPLVDRDETAAPEPHMESRGPAGPPLIDRAMHLLVALLPILLGTVRWYAPVDAYPVSGFPAFCVNSRRVLKSWKEGKPWKPTSLELLRETRLLAASENASSPVLRFLARGHFNQEGDHNGKAKASSLSCDAALKGRIDVLLEALYSKPRRWASSDGSWDGDPGTITHLQFVVTTVKLDTGSLRANLDKASHVQQVVQVSVPHRIVTSNTTKARGAAFRGAKNRGLPLRSVADAPEWARECPTPEWDKKWLLCELDDSGRMRRVTHMWPPPQWHACSKAPCDRFCAVHGQHA